MNSVRSAVIPGLEICPLSTSVKFMMERTTRLCFSFRLMCYRALKEAGGSEAVDLTELNSWTWKMSGRRC